MRKTAAVAKHSYLKVPTPIALIETAERLFAEQGIEGVSLRQIRIEAKVGNDAAIRYHFGDRAQLIAAIWEYRLPVLDRARAALLHRAEAAGLTRDPRTVFDVLTRPGYDLVDEQGRHRYLAFLANAMRWREGGAIRERHMGLSPASIAAKDLLRDIAPQVPADLLRRRLRFATQAFFEAVIERDRALEDGLPAEPEQAFLAEQYDMMAAVCLMPVGPAPA